MQQMKKTDEIRIQSNPRTDFGNITELVASIKEHGILEPILIDKEGTLIAGERRLRSAKILKLEEVPVRILENCDVEAVKIVENIQHKNLNPIEEGIAYQKYLNTNKITEEGLAAKIGKDLNYVKRRLEINGLSAEIKKELKLRNIRLGHALLLAKMEKKQAKDFLKDIKSENLSVAAALDNVTYSSSLDISEAKFNKKDCKDCKHNGSAQTELFETGKKLTGQCLNPVCFRKKVSELVKTLKKKFKDVLFEGEKNWSTPNGFFEENTWNGDQNGITKAYTKKCRKGMDKSNYLVRVGSETGTITEYFKSNKKKNPVQEEVQQQEKRTGNLKTKVEMYKRRLLEKETPKFVTEENGMLQLILYKVETETYADSEDTEIKESFKLKQEQIFKKLTELSKEVVNELNEEELEFFSKKVGFVIEKEFKMEKEFLDLYTKAELLELAAELKIEVKKNLKNPEIKEEIIKGWKPGEVPKILL